MNSEYFRNNLNMKISNGLGSASVLVVDDMATNRGLVKAVLSPKKYTVYEAESGEQALEMIKSLSLDVILMDVLMPGLNGLDTCKKINEQEDFRLIPIIMLTSLGSPDDIACGMDAGASDYVTKPFNAIELQARVSAAIEKKRLTDRLDDAESMLFALARVVEAKDRTTADHCDRLSHTSVVLGKALGLGYEDLEALRRGGLLHDIGKVAIPDKILLKPAKLNEEEWAVIRQHPTIGAHLCSALRTMRSTVDIIRCHHEKWNGSGYPAGLSGEDIPYLARIFQIVDVYDALTSKRPYKKAFPLDDVIKILHQETKNGYWDPNIILVFINILENNPELLELSDQAGSGRDSEIFLNIIGSNIPDWEAQR